LASTVGRAKCIKTGILDTFSTAIVLDDTDWIVAGAIDSDAWVGRDDRSVVRINDNKGNTGRIPVLAVD
jgi:hypothetical protein